MNKTFLVLLTCLITIGMQAQSLTGTWKAAMTDDFYFIITQSTLNMKGVVSMDDPEVGKIVVSVTVPCTYTRVDNLKLDVKTNPEQAKLSIDKMEFKSEISEMIKDSPELKKMVEDLMNQAMDSSKGEIVDGFPGGGELNIVTLTSTKLSLRDENGETINFTRVVSSDVDDTATNNDTGTKALSLISASENTVFKDAIKNYVRSCPAATQSMTAQMKKALSLINTTMVEDFSGKRSEDLLAKYMETTFLDHMTEYMLSPVMSGHITAAELQELTNAMLTPQGKLFQDHLAKVNTKAIPEMEQLGTKLAHAIIDGKMPDPVALRSDCPKSYVALYEQFYNVAKLDSSIESVLAALRQTAGQVDDKFFDSLSQYMHSNMMTLSVNYSFGIMTADDLKYGIKVYSSTAYQHVVESLKNLPQVAQTGGMKLVMGYVEWLGNQGVKLKNESPTNTQLTPRDGETISPSASVNEGVPAKSDVIIGKDADEKIYDVVSQMPSFPGGSSGLMQYISNNIVYPPVCEENEIQGRVICSFVVETDGSISNVSVSKSVDPALDKEALRIIRSMPKWNPGKDKDKPVRVKYTVPITFRLQ